MNRTAILLQQTNPKLIPIEGPECPYCKRKSHLVHARVIYPNSVDIDKNFWKCPGMDCDAFVGVHGHGAWQNFPLGSLANRELRQLRNKAHSLLDHKWKAQKIPRGRMYEWLQKTMKLQTPDAHIGEMNAEQVTDLIHHLNNLYKNNFVL